MLKLFKYLRGSFFTIIIIVLLLCVQAAADLALPDYTSKIVNTGIQAGGIEGVAPKIIRESQMNNLLILTNEDNQILDDYTLISKSTLNQKDYQKYVEQYPELENQSLYLQNNLENDEKEKLDTLMEKPLVILSTLQNEEKSSKIKETMLASIPTEQQAIFNSMNIVDIIKTMPKEQINQMLDSI